MLTPDQLKEYERVLEETKRELVASMVEDQKPAEFGNDNEGSAFDEEADEAEEFANKLATSEAYKERINEIDDAINRIRKGEYGICVSCKQPISETLLKIVPESNHCEQCKKSE